jgi:telomere-associated protein RIF1
LQVAWKGLIDSLIHPPVVACEINAAKEENGVQQIQTSGENSGKIQANGFSKSIKLAMTPLIGIMLSKCDISVHSSCLNTWCYLLHKLDTSVNDPSVIKLVLEPIFEAVFLIGPGSKSMRLWNLCLNLLDDFILAKCRDVEYDAGNLASQHLSARTSILGPSIPGQFSWKQYTIKWLPWDICQLDFHLKMICILINQASIATVTHENRRLSCDAAIALFTSVLKGVRLELRKPPANYDDIMLCLGAVLRFIKKICEDVSSKGSDSNDLHHSSLRFIEAVTQELEPAILGCPLYKVPFDLKYIDNLQSFNIVSHAKVLGICTITYMNMVSPVVYLVAVYFSVVLQLTMKTFNTEFILQGMHKYFKFLFSTYDPLENLLATISLLYKCVSPNCLNIWIAIAKGLKDCMDDVKELLLLRMEFDSTVYLAICYFLSYPFSVCSLPQKNSTSLISSSEKPCVSPQGKFELEHIIKVWMSLYGSLEASQNNCSAMNSFREDLCSILNGCLDEYASMLKCTNDGDLSYKDLVFDLLSLSGDVVICLLEEICTSEVILDESRCKYSGDYKISSGMNSSLRFAARYVQRLLLRSTKLSWSHDRVLNHCFIAYWLGANFGLGVFRDPIIHRWSFGHYVQ